MASQTLNGIASSFIVTPTEIFWNDVTSFLLASFTHLDPSKFHQKIRDGRIFYDDGRPVKPQAPCIAGQRLWYFREIENEVSIPFNYQILHEDEHIIVVDKPHFLSTTPVGNFLHETVVTRMRKQTGNMDITPAHRLDRATAGVLMLTKHKGAREKYQSLFARREVEKTYHAICRHNPSLPISFAIALRLEPNIDDMFVSVVKGKANSQTKVERLQSNNDLCLYQLKPTSGKKHQLRTHMAHFGASIINDNWYPVTEPEGPDNFNKPLQLLAVSLAFTDPFSGRFQEFRTQRRLATELLS